MYDITAKEKQQVLDTFFKDGLEGGITNFPRKEKRKYIIVEQLSRRFEKEKEYSEKDVNEILKAAHTDYVTLRRCMIDFGFLTRDQAGSVYTLIKNESGKKGG